MKKRLTIFFCRTGCDSTDSCHGLDHFHRLQVFTFSFFLFKWSFFSLHSYSTSTRFSLIFNFNDQLNSKYICYGLVKSSRLHQMQASSILHIFNFIHLEPYVKLTILICFVAKLSWFIPYKCSEFFTHILHSLPPHQLSLSYHGAYFTLTFPIPRKFLTSLTFHLQHPINLRAGSGSRRTFFSSIFGV